MTDREAMRAARVQERRERRAHRGVHDQGSTRGAQRAERRAGLLQAAIAGIRKHGSAATMDELAAEAGVTKPILYRHFGDRAGLITAVADVFAAELMSELRASLGEPGDPPDVLAATIDAFVGFIEREPNLYRYLVQHAAPDHGESVVPVGAFLRQVSHEVAQVIGEQLRAAGRDSGGAEVIAHGVVAFVYAAGNQWVERPTMPRTQLVQYVAEFLSTGFMGQGIGGAR